MPLKSLKKQPDKLVDEVKPRFEYIPSLLSLSRIIILPFLVCSFIFNYTLLTFILFLLAIISDSLDGYLARKMNTYSKFGTYFDITADFIFIFGMFRLFVTLELYPYWILALVLFMYIQFLITSYFFKKVQDPLGKYYGSFLFGTIGVTLLFPVQMSYPIVAGIVIVTTISFTSRLIHILKGKIG
ncbi:MAG: CDP-alcohol phosphatidyltransferase family protein [Candidatus Bathyarchaeota archaeon]|nr:CDP-alcohol phosphatidyltransferase family protein [Candidatus Bathyarchaeota archaeon]